MDFDIYKHTWRLSHPLSREQTFKLVIILKSIGFRVAPWWGEQHLIYGDYSEFKYFGMDKDSLLMRCRGEATRKLFTHDELIIFLKEIIRKKQIDLNYSPQN